MLLAATEGPFGPFFILKKLANFLSIHDYMSRGKVLTMLV